MPIALPHNLRRLFATMPLRWALTLPFILPTIGAVSLVGYLSYRNGQEALESLGYQLATATNERITQELKTYLQTPLLVNRLNVDAVNQGQLHLQNVPDLEATLFNRLQQFEQVTAIVFVSPQGRFRAVERLPDLYLDVAEPARPQQMQFYHLDSQGKRGKLAGTAKNLDVRRDRPFYQRAVTTGHLGWNSISQYGTCEALTLDASQPVYDRGTKRLLGVFAVHIRLDYLSQFLQKLDISQTGKVIILEQQGTLVATSTSEQPFKVERGKGAWKRLLPMNGVESRDGLTRSLGQYLRDRPDLLKVAVPSETLKLTYNNERHSFKITPYQDQYGLNWRIITVIPESTFLGAIQKNTQQTILLSWLTLGTAIAVGLLAAHLLLTRFRQFNQGSQALAAGDLDQRLPTDGSIFELNRLAGSFNQMADQLQQSFDRLKTALETSEAKFTTIFRNSPDPMAIATLADGRILEANESQLRFFGYSRDEMIGRTAQELNLWHSGEERERFRLLLQREGQVQNLEVQLRTRAGDIRTVLLSAEVRTLDDQTCLILVFRDVSDRKAAELALQQSEARYRAIVEDQTELICRSLPDTTVLFVNDAYCRYFNVQRQDTIGQPFLSFVHPEDRERLIQEMTALSQTNPILVMENRVVVNGEIRWTQWVDRLLFDDQGNVTEVQAVGRDITELKQVEAALRQSEANLLQAQRIAHLGSWELDLATQKLQWSEEMFRITGLDPTQPAPSLTELRQTVLSANSDELELAVERAIADGTPYEVEHSVRRPDGMIRYVVSKGQVLLNPQQQIIKLYGTVLDITDRKRTEAALQESEARFRELAETVREGFFVFETATARYSYLNPACIAITGIPAVPSTADQDYFRGMSHWLNHIHPADRDRVEQALQEEQQGKNFDQEYRFIRPDGEVRWLRSKAYPIQSETGAVVRIVGTVEDISERKSIEAEIQRLNRELIERVTELQTLFEVLPIGVAIGEDPECRVAYVNPCLSEVLRVPLDQNASPGAPDGGQPAYRPCRDGQQIPTENLPMQYAAAHNIAVRDEVLDIVHPDGTVINLLSYAAPLHDDQGQVRGVVGGFVDITDRKKIEDALRESEELFRRAFDDAPIGISLMAPNGRFLRANAYYCNLLGYTEADLLNLTFQEITYPTDLEADLKGLQQMLTGELPAFQMEKRYITKQGTIIPTVMKTAPIRDPDGKILYFVGHIQDIRERLKIERMKDEFISIISHELRTPLTSIRGALGILGAGVYANRPEKAKHMLEIAINNSDRLVRLINDILDLERLQSGKVELIVQPCQIADLMQQAVDSVQAIADQSVITLSLTAVSATVWVAPDAIVQTLTNLLSNAIKFSFPGGTVSLQAELRGVEEWEGRTFTTLPSPPPPHLPSTPYLLLSVTDQGRGIPADKLDVIFEQFQQVDVSDSRNKRGTGLGLAICKNIVQQHSGKIWVESRIGHGSTFYFTLPLRREQNEQLYA